MSSSENVFFSFQTSAMYHISERIVIKSDLFHHLQVKVQWTEQLVATQQQKTEQIKKETEQLKVYNQLPQMLSDKDKADK